MKPNLFKLATKELSQDAFLAWLLQWADPSAAEHNDVLQRAAMDFLKRLIALQSSVPDEISRVEAGRQWENIDVWAEVNHSHLIIIEDKVGTRQHSDQLTRYRENAEELCREKGLDLVCVYLKTHSDSSSNIERIESQGYAVFSRSDLLEFLNHHETDSDIYNDFRNHLREIEAKESGFSENPIGCWKAGDWKGFYRELEKTRGLVDWGYVNNPSGGFWCAVLNRFKDSKDSGVCPYIQIEQGDLCFKIAGVYENRREVRTRYHRMLMEAAEPDMGLTKPRKFGSGTYMTVAIVPRAVWLGQDDDLLDFDSVLERLARYENWLSEIVGKL